MNEVPDQETPPIAEDIKEFFADGVHWLCPAGSKTKEHWFIDRENDKRFRCRKCDKIVMQQKGSTSNLCRHLRKCLDIDEEEAMNAMESDRQHKPTVQKKPKLGSDIKTKPKTKNYIMDPARARFNELILRTIVTSGAPYSLVENPYLQELTKQGIYTCDCFEIRT